MEFREIDKSNYWDCIALTIDDMQLEGIQRSQTKDLHGNWVDLYFYGLLEDDWRKHE